MGNITGGTYINTIAQYAEMPFEYRYDVREILPDMNKYFLYDVAAYRIMDKVSVDLELLGERPCTGDVDQEKQDALVNKALDIIEAFTGKRVECESGSRDCNIALSTCVPTLCIRAHIGPAAHPRDDCLNVKDLHMGMEIVAAFMMTYMN